MARRSALGGGAHGLNQSVIAGKTVHLQGAKISPTQVAKFVDHKRVQLRSGVFQGAPAEIRSLA